MRLLAPCLSFAVLACGDHHHHHDHALVPGAADGPAEAACAAFSAEVQPDPVPLGETPAALDLDSGLAHFTLEPAQGRTVEVTLVEHTTLALFSDRDDLVLQLQTDDGTTYNLSPRAMNGACPDESIADFRLHIHSPGPHELRIPDDAEGTLRVLLIAAEIGH